ncbi:MAG: hypothetical protein PHV02_21445 [Rhodocyclaceae bacterium]|nr:hypothetical protein [Rhodocyclaceae bacterium]
MAKQDSILTNPRKENKEKPALTVPFQTPRDRHIEELVCLANSMSDKGLLMLLGAATFHAENSPSVQQNASIISMTEWQAAKDKGAA